MAVNYQDIDVMVGDISLWRSSHSQFFFCSTRFMQVPQSSTFELENLLKILKYFIEVKEEEKNRKEREVEKSC